jgi:hypothetical protein
MCLPVDTCEGAEQDAANVLVRGSSHTPLIPSQANPFDVALRWLTKQATVFAAELR